MIEEYHENEKVPLVKGGQGRTDEKTEGDGWLALYVVVGAVFLVAAFYFGGC